MATDFVVDAAILDSMIKPAFLPPNVNLNRVKVVKKSVLPIPSNVTCKHHHGTICARIIASRLGKISLLGIDIFGTRQAASLDKLLVGMQYAIEFRPRIIHLSVGLARHHRMDELREICRQADKQKIILVAAASCERKTWPACFRFTLAVAAEEEMAASCKNNTSSQYWDITASGVDKKSAMRGSSIAAARVTNELLKFLLVESNFKKRGANNEILSKIKDGKVLHIEPNFLKAKKSRLPFDS